MRDVGYRVLFMTGAGESGGFWLRYTSMRGIDKRKHGVWITLFCGDKPEGLHLRYEGIKFTVNDYFEVSGPELYFSSRDGEAYFNGKGIKWRFSIEGENKFNTIPLLLRIIRRESRYILVYPYAVFDGEIVFKDKRYGFPNIRGMVGYISSKRYLHHWAWAHCSGFEEDAEGWIDLLMASPDGKRNILFGALKYRGNIFKIGGLLGSKFDGEYGLGLFKGGCSISGGVLEFKFVGDREDIIIAEYEDPIEGYRYCHNTEVGDAELLIKTRDAGEVRLSCRKRAFMETVLPSVLDEGLPRIEVL
jgi:hypothetical protein